MNEISSIVGPQGLKLSELSRWMVTLEEEDFLMACEVPVLLQVPLEKAGGGLDAALGIGATERYERPEKDELTTTLSISKSQVMGLERKKDVADALVHLLLSRDPEREEVTIGRGEDCDVVLAESTVSKKHAEVRHRMGQYVLVDLGSHNGTYLDGRRLDANTPVPLQGMRNLWFSGYRAVFLFPEQLYELGSNLGRQGK